MIAEPDFLLATHPHSNHADVENVILRLLLAGYRNSGFKQPKIDVELVADGGAVIRIDEGPRVRCGGVRVTGAQQIDLAQLVERLTLPFAKENTFPSFIEVNGKPITRWVDAKGTPVRPEEPVWKRDSPVKFDREQALTKSAQVALTDLGYSAASIQVTIESNTADSTADLVVDIRAEGAQDRAEIFNVVGSNVNAPNDVLAFLELEPGLAIDQLQWQKLTKQLWDSGRFTKHLLRFDRDEKGTGRLNIELADVRGVPPLKEPLSDIAQIFLRARTWLSGIDDRGEDLVFTSRNAACRVQMVHSHKGLLIQFTGPEIAQSVDGDAGMCGMAFLVDQSSVTLEHSQSPTVWAGDIQHFKGSIRLETKLAAADSDDHFSNVTFNASCHSERSADEPLLSHHFNFSPADWSAFAYKSGLDTSVKDGRMYLVRDDHSVEMDVASGQVYRWDSGESEVRLQVGVFDQMRDQIAQAVIDKANVYEPARPVTTLAKHLLSETSWQGINNIRTQTQSASKRLDGDLRSACDKLVSGGLLMPLDAFAKHTAEFKVGNRFQIPDNSAPTLNYQRWAFALVGKFVLRYVPDLFAEGTWPMTVAREACLVLVDRGKHTGTILLFEHKSEPDPLTVLQLLSYISSSLLVRCSI